ncbi:MAG: SdpI family protein [Bacilli bacterium]|nr:SdpI family protein [Bacilli bacterium]
MGFWIFILIMILVIPLIMIIFGRHFSKHTPRTINTIFGYRTRLSMRNMNTWDFAHKYIGKIWFVLGLIVLPVSVIPLLFFLDADNETIGIVGGIIVLAQLLPFIIPIIPTELALKRNFITKDKRD